ncbi:MAG: glycosyltransferase, partial [Frankiales bacterium]|nr:glycosyltransferase [Frankiales bacterium]
MLRVLYSFPHPYGAPGIGTTARKQVEALARLGHDVTLVTTSTTVDPGVRTVRTMQRGRVRIPHRALGVERAWAYHDLVASRMLKGYDVVHAWPLGSRHTLAAAARLGVAGFREAPNCHTEHAYEVVGTEYRRLGLVPPAGHSHAHNAGRLATERAEYAAATKVLVPSPFVERTFLERGVTNLARHRYGYDPADFPAAPTRTRGPLRAVFVGHCEPRKGLHFALEAWRAAGVDGTFEIYGSFMPGYREILGELPAGVTIKGFTNDVRSVYGAADVLLLPSLEEGSALVTYEAQAMGA